MNQLGFGWDSPQRKHISVSELTEHINELLGSAFPDIWIAGEISGAKLSTAGHWYFNLKDDAAQIRCACFRMQAMRLRVKPEDGMAVLVRGRVEVYPARGEYQLIVETLEVQGLGALQAAFEQLKKKLASEGLFDPARRRELPVFPRRIGIVTSPTGAAIHDMLQILRRRAPGSHIRLYPAMVQGDGAIQQVVRGIQYFSRSGWAEVIIVGRGGGSLEDLWTFNEERVARAIAASTVPIVSAVGHETDFTIADFVADLRAPTPSAAAELVTQHWVDVRKRLEACDRHLARAIQLALARARERVSRRGTERLQWMMQRRINRLAQKLDELDSRLRRRDLRLHLRDAKARLEKLDTRALRAMRAKLASIRPRVETLEASVRHLSPLKVLERGFAIVHAAGTLVKSPEQAPPGTKLRIRVAKGEFPATAVPSPTDNSELPSQ